MRFLLTLIAGLLAPSLFAANLSFLAPTNNVLPTNLGKFRASNIVAAVNLGVGIDSPQEAVHVASNILVNGTKVVLSHTNNDGSVPQFRIESNSGGNYKTSVWSTAAISSTAPGQSFQVGTPAGAWTFDGSTAALTPPDITTDFGSISSPISNIVASAGSVLVLNGGRVGIETNAPQYSLHVNGNVSAAGVLGLTNSLGTNTIYPQWKFAAWGDSLSVSTTYPLHLGILSGRPVYGGGVIGETTAQILLRNTNVANNYLRNWSRVIWGGVNDIAAGGITVEQMTNNIYQMVTNGDSRYLVLGTFNLTNWPIGHANYVITTNLNAQLAAAYGSRYFDMRSYIISRYDTNILQDRIDWTNDVPVSSLRLDNVHLNTAGYRLVAAKVFDLFLRNETNELDRPVTRGEYLQTLLSAPSHGPLTIVQSQPTATAVNPLLTVSTSNGIPLLHLRVNDYSINHNLFFGLDSGASHTTSDGNAAFGPKALTSLTTGVGNVGVGKSAWFSLTTGGENTAVGFGAGILNVSGNANTAVGSAAFSLGTGTDNTMIGASAGRLMTSGNANTAVGRYALENGGAGASAAFGALALRNAAASAQNNSAFGHSALNATTSGTDNTAMGHSALAANISGNWNTAIGRQAGYGDGSAGVVSTNDDYCIFLGYNAGRDSSIQGTKMVNAMAIGKNAKILSTNTAVIGGTGADAVKIVSHGGITLGNGGVSITNVLTGSASLDFAAQTLGATPEDLPITVAGAADGDVVELAIPVIATTNIVGSFNFFASNGVVFVRFVSTGTAQNPSGGTFRALVKKLQ